MNTKVCGSCQTKLSLDKFGKNKTRSDGLQGQCRSCRSIKQKASESYREYQRSHRRARTDADRERDRKRNKDRYAADPKLAQDRAAEWKRQNPERKKENDRRWRKNNKDRANKNAKNWVLNNPEKRRESVKKYDQANKDKRRINSARYRARKQAVNSVRYTEQQLIGKLIVWRYRCYLCDELLDDTLHWDHVKPLVSGGADMLCNLRPTHGICNRRKSGKWPLEKD